MRRKDRIAALKPDHYFKSAKARRNKAQILVAMYDRLGNSVVVIDVMEYHRRVLKRLPHEETGEEGKE